MSEIINDDFPEAIFLELLGLLHEFLVMSMVL